MPYVNFVNPACTADVIVENDNFEVLLIERGDDPYMGMKALPGGHINLGLETTEEAGARELNEETGLIVRLEDLTCLGSYSAPKRDPRGHYVTHVYYTRKFDGILQAGDDARDAGWYSLNDLPELAFDHGKILRDYLEVRGR